MGGNGVHGSQTEENRFEGHFCCFLGIDACLGRRKQEDDDDERTKGARHRTGQKGKGKQVVSKRRDTPLILYTTASYSYYTQTMGQ